MVESISYSRQNCKEGYPNKKMNTKISFLISILCLLLKTSQAETLIDGIAFKVNNYPITLYEISKLKKDKKISDKEARHLLILKAVKLQEMQRLQIEASELDIDRQIEAAASMKGISRDEFVAGMLDDGYSYEELRSFYKDQIEDDLLTQRILSTSLKIVDERELKKYYDEHKNEFSMPKEVVVIQYAAQNEKMLAQAINNPLIRIPGVSRREEKVALSGVNLQIAQLFAQTQKGQFTPIVNNGGASLAFYIKDKTGSILMPFDQIKQLIMQKVILSRKEKILQEYFDRLIASAIVVEIRK